MDPVEICNMALGWLGEKPITALADESTAAELCDANYATAVKAALEARAWSFAAEWLQLAADATPPAAPDFEKRFLLPATVLKVLACDDGSGSRETPWRREGNYVLADVDPLGVQVVQLVDDPARWSASFAHAVAYKLAALLAIPLTENRALHADMVQIYQAALREAGLVDAPQGRSERPIFETTLHRRRW